jgi:hypothetical protein
MKEIQSESKLRKKVSLSARPRSYPKEEDVKKRPVTSEDLEKMKSLDYLLESIILQIDPFTISSSDQLSISSSLSNYLSPQDPLTQELIKEFILDPQKQKKSNSQSEFSECKKKFDLISNREDPDQNSLSASRFQLYSSSIPLSSSVQEKIDFLKSIPQASSSLSRKQVLRSALNFKSDSGSLTPTTSSKSLIDQVLKEDPSPSLSLSNNEKLVLLRSISKFMCDWEKIEKEFKDKPVSVDQLKKIWRCLKVSMKEEVAELKKKVPNFHYIKWLRAAVKKLDSNHGKKNKNKVVGCSSLKPREQRIDMLSIMAEAEDSKRFGIESSSFLNFTASSSFKAFGTDEL